MQKHPPFRSGFVSIVGRPNAGKSTLLNALVGDKLAIVSERPQTTRTSVQGVITLPHAQIVFIDTPGVHQAPALINKRMLETVKAALQDRDVVLLVADALETFNDDDQQALDMVRHLTAPVFLVLNKIDGISHKQEMLPRLQHYQSLFEFAEFYPVSALTGEGLIPLRDAIVARLQEGPPYYPADYITDQPERFLAAELIREKILVETRQEVPHSVAVVVETWEDSKKLVRIAATIYVERAGQKGIVIGAKGAMLKNVGTLARLEIEKLTGKKVFLELFVKVRADWRESPQFLDAIDWRSMHGTKLEADPEKIS